MKMYRLSMRRMEAIYQYRRYGWCGDTVTIEDLEQTDDVRNGESFGVWFDRQKGRLDIYEEVCA